MSSCSSLVINCPWALWPGTFCKNIEKEGNKLRPVSKKKITEYHTE